MASSAVTFAAGAAPSPIVFKSRGPPDVCLAVFSQYYYVHSAVLKLHSEYFFKFFDSPDKEYLPSVSTQFKYVWVTKVDADGKGWMLTSAGPKAGDLRYSVFQGNVSHEIEVFGKLLCALYDRSYTFNNFAEFADLATMAGFYRALPRVSNSLGAAIHNSTSGFKLLIMETKHRSETLEIALQLRHRELFKDSVIFECSRLELWESSFDDSPGLSLALDQTLTEAKRRLREQIVKVQRTLMKETFKYKDHRAEVMDSIWEQMRNATKAKSTTGAMFRLVHNKLRGGCGFAGHGVFQYTSTETSRVLSKIMANDLHFIPQLLSEEKHHDHRWLCNNIDDDDLPWNTTDSTW